ncbi:MAG TPA: hypothetical protein VHU40_10820, partial [Polyangia bacterium]|nr:hypothetical protein [Polyangia bacterium]
MAKDRFQLLRGKLAIAALSSIVTLFVGFVVINLLPGEKKLTSEISSSYGVEDEAFARRVSTLFGPALTDGNRVEPLENGAEIFPAML